MARLSKVAELAFKPIWIGAYSIGWRSVVNDSARLRAQSTGKQLIFIRARRIKVPAPRGGYSEIMACAAKILHVSHRLSVV